MQRYWLTLSISSFHTAAQTTVPRLLARSLTQSMQLVEEAIRDGPMALAVLVTENEDLMGELEKPVATRIAEEVRRMCEAGTIPAQQMSDIFGVLARQRRECLRVSEE
ncbi:hypothetical protein FOZ63_014505, partial [Perkinsus olseni]